MLARLMIFFGLASEFICVQSATFVVRCLIPQGLAGWRPGSASPPAEVVLVLRTAVVTAGLPETWVASVDWAVSCQVF